MQIHHLTNKAIAVTGLPEGATNFDVNNLCSFMGFDNSETGSIDGVLNLPPGNWSILGRAIDLTEDDWKRVVDKSLERNTPDGIQYGYMISPMDTEIYNNATDCGQMLVKSEGLHVSNPNIEEPKEQDFVNHGGFDDPWQEYYLKALLEWQSAELISNPLILIQ